MLVDFWAILIFAIITLLFLILFAFNKADIKKNIDTQFQDKDINFMLQSFLRAPAMDYGSISVADIIAQDAVQNDYSRTKKLCEQYFKYTTKINQEKIFEMNLYIDGKKIEIINEAKKGTARKSTTKTYIPGYDSTMTVELEIWSIFNPHT